MLLPTLNQTAGSPRKEGGARLEGTACCAFSHSLTSGGTLINNTTTHLWDRLSKKNLQQQLTQALITGLNCSPFEAKAILETVHKIYHPYLDVDESVGVGQVKFLCLGIENSPGTSIGESSMVLVRLTLDGGAEDLQIRKAQGVSALRQHRLQRLTHQAYQQGGLLTLEDLAYRLFNCGQRTLVRDLATLKSQGVILPLRSTIKDMGRSISHRSSIIRQWLAGKEYSEIARASYHSVDSVANYVGKFTRCVALAQEGFDVNTIGFLVGISPKLAAHYFKLYDQLPATAHRRQWLQQLSTPTTQNQMQPKKTNR
jgi:hypothetical protein